MLDTLIFFVPHGNRKESQRLHRIRIVNQGTGDEEVGNYLIVVDGSGSRKVVEYRGFPRERGALALVHEVLGCLLEEAP